MTIKTQPQCRDCQKKFHTRTAHSHLKSRISKADTIPRRTPTSMLLVSATAGYDDTKTVYTLMPKNATLRDIDEMLRTT